MNRRLLFITGFLLCLYSSQAQFDTSFVKKNIRHCADSMALGFRTRNWDLVTRYTYPAIVGSMGGKKAFRDYIANIFSQTPDSAWKRYEMGTILQVVQKGRDLQAVIELHSVIEWQNMRITTTSHLVGESWDGGMFWTFFDPQGEPKAARQINPNLSEELIIPKTEEKRESLTKSKTGH